MSETQPASSSTGIVRRGGITLAGAALGALLVFGNEIQVARFLGVPSYGLYALALVVARVAETVALFGLRAAVMHFLPVQREEGALGASLGTIIAAVALPLVLGCALSALLWFSADWMARVLLDAPAVAPFLRLFALPVPLMALTEVLGVITRGFGRAEYYVLIRNLTPPACFAALLAVVNALDAPPAAVAWAFGVSQAVAALTGMTVVGWLIGRHDGWRRPTFAARRLYAYAFPIMLNTLLYVVMGATDILMLGHMRGPEEAGVLRACLQLRPAFDMAMVAFNAGAVHLYPVQHRAGDHAALAASYRTVLRAVGGVSAGLCMLVMLSRHDVLALLGPAFVTGADAMAWLLAGLLVQGCLGSAGMLLVVVGHQREETLAAALGMATNVLLNLWLIPRLGLTGAALAAGASLVVMNLVRVRFVRATLGLATWDRAVLGAIVLATVIGAVTAALMAAVGLADGAGLWAMIARSALALALFVGAAWLFARHQRELLATRES